MGRMLVLIAIAGCSFRSPGGSTAGGDAQGADDADAIDAAKVDAAGFDPATCPAGYDVKLPSFPRAKYRIITSNAVYQSQYTQCTVTGTSHLVALETAAEVGELGAALQLVPSPTNGWFYAGAMQKPGQLTTDVEWSWLIGGAVTPALWGLFNTLQQPNDADGLEDDTENFAVIDRAQLKLLDVTGATGYGAVCECDGKAIVP
jgi:hypothetical protein